MKFPKLHLVCGTEDLRPQFGFVQVTKELTVATDAHIIVKHQTRDVFKDDFIESLPEAGIMIYATAIKLICRLSTLKVSLSDDKKMIQLHQKDGSIISYNCQPDLPFPKFDHLFPKIEDCKPLAKIGISARLLSNLYQGMGNSPEQLRLHFYGDHQGILVIPNNRDDNYPNVVGLIMPAMMPEL